MSTHRERNVSEGKQLTHCNSVAPVEARGKGVSVCSWGLGRRVTEDRAGVTVQYPGNAEADLLRRLLSLVF